MFEEYNKTVEEYYIKKAQEWNDLVDAQIDKILNKVNSFLPKDVKLEHSDIEDTVKECINKISSYTCKEMIDID